ncbi:MAG TPA: (d)CMP kinase [Candidatus Margulisbacteria bacterium]|nr:(d)CMP kinase [Candidatus Margulisiibacteriota bacterium]
MQILPYRGRYNYMSHVVIAIDGPAGSGKSTIAKILAEKLNFLYLDTGAMYRAIAYKVIEVALAIENKNAIIDLAGTLTLSFEKNEVTVNGQNVSKQIRLPEVNTIVSNIAAIPEIRHILIAMQRKIAINQNVVMEGRDIGTVVFPDAACKFFLSASVHIRAVRRFQELKPQNPDITISQVEQSINYRDTADTNRTVSPLTKAEDAIEIDTSNMSIEEVSEHLHGIILKKLNINVMQQIKD